MTSNKWVTSKLDALAQKMAKPHTAVMIICYYSLSYVSETQVLQTLCAEHMI